MNSPIYFRDKNKFIELIKPWKIKDPGFLHLEEWYDRSPTLAKDLIGFAEGEGIFGGFLEK